MEVQDDRAVQQHEPASPPRFKGFFGCYAHTIDSKNRIIIPLSLREQLGNDFFIALSMDEDCIEIYPEEQWYQKIRHMRDLIEVKPSLKNLFDRATKLSWDHNNCDAQGRVVIPQRLRDKVLKDSRDVDICGAWDCIRVLTKETSDLEDIVTEEEKAAARVAMDEAALILRQLKS